MCSNPSDEPDRHENFVSSWRGKKTTILLADDHAVVRQGLKALLAFEADLEIIGEAENGRQAVSMAKETEPDIVLMDLAMPLLNGIEATRQIMKSLPSVRVLVLSSYSDAHCVRQMADAGAAGYLLKQMAAKELVQAIHEVRKGRTFFSSGKTIRRGKQTRAGSEPVSATQPLTLREAEVLQLVAEGFATKQVAAELGLSIKTIDKHRQQIMDKLGIHEVAGLTRYAVSKAMVEVRRPPGL
jgi:DNA-binding NarL/FixJ family response regulator